jgi:hypothetical protein
LHINKILSETVGAQAGILQTRINGNLNTFYGKTRATGKTRSNQWTNRLPMLDVVSMDVRIAAMSSGLTPPIMHLAPTIFSASWGSLG